jgi:O-antigen ligase
MESLFFFFSGEGSNEGSINMRSYMIKLGFEMFKNKLFIGHGIDNYRVLLSMNTGIETYAHNNYIELMVDVGIFGVTIYYLTHIILLRELFCISKETINKTLCYVFISIIISYIILSCSLIYYDNKHFSILLALASIFIKITKSDKHNTFE